MTRFNKVKVDKAASTVEIGAGLMWDDVYRALDGTGLNVLGGRVSGVGVAGFILGGGERSSCSTVLWLVMGTQKDIRGRRISMDLRLILWIRTSSCSQTEPFR
jgi:FAD binding domain